MPPTISISALACLLVTVSSAWAQPILEVVGEHPTFGKVLLRSPNDRPRLPIEIRNVSGTDQKIEQVAVGCGCIDVEEFAPFVLKSGATAQVVLLLNPLKVTAGNVKYPLVIYGGGKQLLQADVSYAFQPRILPIPRIIWLHGADGADMVATAELRLRGLDVAELVASSDDPRLAITIARGEDGLGAQLSVRVVAGEQVGAIESMVEIAPRDRERFEGIFVEVRGAIEHPVVAAPAVVMFKPIPVGKTSERTIELRRRDGTKQSIEVASVSSDAEAGLSLKTGSSSDGALQIVVTASGQATRLQTANVTIRLVGVDEPIVVPVSWRSAR